MTIAILAVITLLEGVRRVPAGGVVLQRILFGAWRPRGASPRGERLQLPSWWSPILSAIILMPSHAQVKCDLETLQARLEQHRRTLVDLRILGLAVLPALVIGIPIAIERFGAVGFFVALAVVLLLCLMIVEAMFSAARSFGKPIKAALGWSMAFLSPFAAPRAAEILIEEVVRDVPPGLVARALLPFDEFLRWVRPHAYDARQELLIGLDRRELEQALAPPAQAFGVDASLWCPRCGATYVHGDTCSECGIGLLAFAGPQVAGPVA